MSWMFMCMEACLAQVVRVHWTQGYIYHNLVLNIRAQFLYEQTQHFIASDHFLFSLQNEWQRCLVASSSSYSEQHKSFLTRNFWSETNCRPQYNGFFLKYFARWDNVNSGASTFFTFSIWNVGKHERQFDVYVCVCQACQVNLSQHNILVLCTILF